MFRQGTTLDIYIQREWLQVYKISILTVWFLNI